MADLENDERATIIRRMARRYFEVLEEHNDPDDLIAAQELIQYMEQRLMTTAHWMVKNGWSLSRVAEPLRMSKQTLLNKLKNHETAPVAE